MKVCFYNAPSLRHNPFVKIRLNYEVTNIYFHTNHNKELNYVKISRKGIHTIRDITIRDITIRDIQFVTLTIRDITIRDITIRDTWHYS